MKHYKTGMIEEMNNGQDSSRSSNKEWESKKAYTQMTIGICECLPMDHQNGSDLAGFAATAWEKPGVYRLKVTLSNNYQKAKRIPGAQLWGGFLEL